MKNHNPTSASHLLRQCTASALIGLCGLASAAQSEAFTFASVDIFDKGPLEGTTSTLSNTDPVFVERGLEPAAYGKSRAAFGSNGFAILSGAGATSIWSDRFTITYTGPGPMLVNFSVDVRGAIIGDADMHYNLLVSDQPFDLPAMLASLEEDNEQINIPGSTSILKALIMDDQKSPHMTLTGTLPVLSGQTFYLASVFRGDVCTPLEGPEWAGCPGGSEDFFHSANFGISRPAGSTIATLSNTVYAQAVPEASSLMLTLAGLATAAGLARQAKVRRNC